jgi:16S rRNA (adenine1518-N6/adenine1519-N6)-dimethyltransferase
MLKPKLGSIKNRLKESGIKPSKKLGQNFLSDPDLLNSIVECAEITRQDVVVEVGSGLGDLTARLACSSKKVIAVEIDNNLVSFTRKQFKEYQSIKIIEGDILTTGLEPYLGNDQYMVVANIPYYMTSAIIKHFLELDTPPFRLVLTIQKEVAERIIEKSGKSSLLSTSVRVFGDPKLVRVLPAEVFYPVPEVDSAVIRVDRFTEPLVPNDKMKVFFQVVRAGYSQKRKKILNSLSAGMQWEKSLTHQILLNSGIDASRRPETLSVVDWLKITLSSIDL